MSKSQLEYRKYLRIWRHKQYGVSKNLQILDRLAGFLFCKYGNDLHVIGRKIDQFMPEFMCVV